MLLDISSRKFSQLLNVNWTQQGKSDSCTPKELRNLEKLMSNSSLFSIVLRGCTGCTWLSSFFSSQQAIAKSFLALLLSLEIKDASKIKPSCETAPWCLTSHSYTALWLLRKMTVYMGSFIFSSILTLKLMLRSPAILHWAKITSAVIASHAASGFQDACLSTKS